MKLQRPTAVAAATTPAADLGIFLRPLGSGVTRMYFLPEGSSIVLNPAVNR